MKPESYMTYKEVVDSLRSEIFAANAKVEKLRETIRLILEAEQRFLPARVVLVLTKALADTEDK